LILSWQKDQGTTDNQLNHDLQAVGIALSVFAHRIGDAFIDLRVGIVEHRDDSIADVGFGVSQVLPVLVALRAAQPGRLVYLEEPEIHLHPRAQAKLADILAGAAERGVRVVVETHSTLLLTAIQTLVRRGDLKPGLVKLHWFERDPKTGITEVSSTGLDKNGAFGDWPEDFDEVILAAEREYLDAVTERSTG
jgi:predicted ATPase